MINKKLSYKRIYTNKGVLNDAIYFDQAGSKKTKSLRKLLNMIGLRRIIFRTFTLIIFTNFLFLMGISTFFNFIYKFFDMLTSKIVMQFVRLTISVDEQ